MMGWRAWQLSWAALSALLLVEITIIVVIAVLDYLSQRDHGFVSISLTSLATDHAGLQSLWGQAFLWTTIPTLLMTVFGLTWVSAVEAYAAEMPLRVLHQPRGSTLERTVLLDYRRYLPLYNWVVAWKNQHKLLGLCMLFALIAKVVLGPLAAHLFQLITPVFEKDAIFVQRTKYDGSAPIAILDYSAILGAVAAVRQYGGTWPLWTDGVYAVADFSLPEELVGLNITKLRRDTVAYSADLDCEVVTNFTVARSPNQGDTATLTFTAVDRGCDISLSGGVSPGSQIYLKTVSMVDCSSVSGFSRLAFYAGSYSASARYLMDSLSIISCIPHYKKTVGSFSAPPSLHPMSFHTDEAPTDGRPKHWRNFEQDMLSLSDLLNNNSPYFTSRFGSVVLGVASKSDHSSVLAPDTLISTASTVFSSVYAMLVITQFLQPQSEPAQVNGSITVMETRLAVVSWSAYTTIAIVAVLIVLTISLAIVVHLRAQVFAEEPRGMLTAASALYGSDLWSYVDEANRDRTYRGQLCEWLKRTYALGDEACEVVPGRGIQVGTLKRAIRDFV